MLLYIINTPDSGAAALPVLERTITFVETKKSMHLSKGFSLTYHCGHLEGLCIHLFSAHVTLN